MRPEVRKYFRDVLKAGETIQQCIAGVDFDDFRHDALRRDAVERQFIIVGEALFQLRKLDPQAAEQVPDVSRIIGFRHRLVHGYDRVDAAVVWDAARKHLPGLLHAVRALLNE